jgi:hypothetical protein
VSRTNFQHVHRAIYSNEVALCRMTMKAGTKPATKIEFGTEDVGKYLCFIRDGMR